MPNADSYRVTEGVLEGVDMWSTKEGLKGALVSLIWGCLQKKYSHNDISSNRGLIHYLTNFHIHFITAKRFNLCHSIYIFVSHGNKPFILI